MTASVLCPDWRERGSEPFGSVSSEGKTKGRGARHAASSAASAAAMEPHPAMERTASKPPLDGVSIEPLSDATLEGARAVFNDFVRRSNKRFLFGCCPACDEPAWRFAKAFDADPSRLRTAAVAVRRADGKVMGAVVCTTHGQTRTGDERAMAPDPKPGTSLVEWIAVLPEARNRGIGSALLTHAFGAVRQTPWDATRSMKLTVVGGNRAKRLYDRLGFETVGPNGVLEKCVGGCALCCLIGCPYGRPCAGYDDMAKAL